VSLALGEAMEADGRVRAGRGRARGGAYGRRWGCWPVRPVRVRDTPISEAAIVRYSVGAPACGAEIMHFDFTRAPWFSVNQATKTRYMSGGKARRRS
jgi:pyruvate/2-oxoglutarate/acetoin dehydrogenase E1 component